MADQIYDLAEPGMEEFQSSKLLADYLQNHGFTVEMGIAGLPTAFRAVYEQGEGGPSFGFLEEYDALKDIGHAPVITCRTVRHWCRALALRTSAKEQSYKIVVYGTPAGRNHRGKIIMQEKRMLPGHYCPDDACSSYNLRRSALYGTGMLHVNFMEWKATQL